MAVKQVILSDISGEEVDDKDAAVLVVTGHPSISGSVELDISSSEADKFQNVDLDIVTVTVKQGGSSRDVMMDKDTFEGLFGDLDVPKTLKYARKSSSTSSSSTSTKRSSGPKIDYTSPEHAGKLHRGKVTDEEAEWVRNNKEKASKNREAQGKGPIDWNDPAEKERYGIA